jgi:hypothetical protein
MGSEMSGLSAECKADLILANEGRLRKTNELYRAFNEKKSCLVNNYHIFQQNILFFHF